MINLDNVTFIIPLRIDSDDRLRNIIITTSYLLNKFDCKLIIKESDNISKFNTTEMICSIDNISDYNQFINKYNFVDIVKGTKM